MKDFYNIIFDDMTEYDIYLEHVGKGHKDGGHSGRYPWGSGEDPYQHEGGFRGYVKSLKEAGVTEGKIADHLNITSTELRARIAVEGMQERTANVEKVVALHDKGMNPTQIARVLGLKNESSVRSLLDPVKDERNRISKETAKMLKEEVDKYGTTDVSKGTELRLNISKNKLAEAIVLLESEGYMKHNINVKQLGTGKTTRFDVIVPPGQDWKETMKKRGEIHIINDTYTEDGGRSWQGLEKPQSISRKRILVRYRDDPEGGLIKDGLIEIRPGVEDLDMGNNTYAQVRIGVDDKMYMKGMAVYNPNIPEGYDVIYNTKHTKEEGDDEVFKKMKKKDDGSGEINWENPFKSSIKFNEYDENNHLVREVGQRHYIGKDGQKHLSAINIINEEGDWGNWKKTLASQMLGKQSPELAERQLGLAYDKSAREFDEIMGLTNTAVQQRLLASFADDCDSKAVHLKAAALPGQRSHVLIPLTTIKSNEIYAPNYKNGEIVSLIRYPHTGTHEIPTLVVNNNNREAKLILGTHPKDAIGISRETAVKLSGADFDGDSALVIPNPEGKLIKSSTMKGLADFDDEVMYKHKDGDPTVGMGYDEDGKKKDGFNTQMQMGIVSNLITDMYVKGADPKHLERAVKYSMVVIDAEKHNLNWKQAEKDFNVQELKKIYQKQPDGKYGGTSTLLSRAKSEQRVPERKQFYVNQIDKKTGEINWEYTGAYKKKKDPKTGEYYTTNELKTQKSTKMYEAKDANELSTGTIIESVYANYANKMKALGNEARKALINTKNMPYDPNAKKAYEKEVSDLLAQLNEVKKNKPLERKAQAMANAELSARRKDFKEQHGYDMPYEDAKKIGSLCLSEARRRMGTYKHRINISPKAWEAVQAGAIRHSTFREILNNVDLDEIKSYATPFEYTPKMSKSEIAMAKNMLNRYTPAEVADYFGISTSTLYKDLKL